MKKVFKSMIVVLSFLSMGMLTTSCDENSSIGGILSNLFGNLLGGQSEVYNYIGTGTSECLDASDKGWTYINGTKPSALSSVPVKLSIQNSLATLEFPSYKDGQVEVHDVAFYNLALSTSKDGSYSVLSVGEKSTIDGYIMYEGKKYNARSVFVETKSGSEGIRATTEGLLLDICIYFLSDSDTDYSKAVNFTYNGKIVTE